MKITTIAGVVVLAGAAYVGASWYVGQQAETQIRHAVLQANDGFLKTFGRGLDGSGATLVLKDYQRGWFSSNALYQLNIKLEDDEQIQLGFSDHLQHGPFPLDLLKTGNFTPMLAYSQSRLLPAPAIQAWFDNQKGMAPIHANTQIKFGGKGQSVVTFAPVDHVLDDEALNFSGGAITIEFSNNFQDSVSTGVFDSLKYVDQQEDQAFELKGLVVNNKVSKVDQRITTESSATIAKLMVTDEQEIKLEQLQADLNAVQQDNMLNGSATYSIKKTLVDDLDLGNTSLTASIAKLDVVALTDLVETYYKMDPEGSGDGLTDAQDALLQEKLLAILAAKPEISIKPWAWSNTAGTSTAGVSIQLTKPNDLTTAQDDPFNALTQIVEKVSIDAKISRAMFVRALESIGDYSDEPIDASEATAAFDEYLGSFEESGLLKLDKDGATLDLLYKNGEIVLNGKEMPLESFMMLIMLLAM